MFEMSRKSYFAIYFVGAAVAAILSAFLDWRIAVVVWAIVLVFVMVVDPAPRVRKGEPDRPDDHF